MHKKSFNVVGILIGDDGIKLYHMNETWVKYSQDGIYTRTANSDSCWAASLNLKIISYLRVPRPANTQFVVVYDVSCLNKEKYIKRLLEDINAIKKNDVLPTLISIGHEETPLCEEITKQVVIINEVANTGDRNDLFKNIIGEKLKSIKAEMEANTLLYFIIKTQRVIDSNVDKINSYLKSKEWNDWPNALDTIDHLFKELDTIRSEIKADLLSDSNSEKFLVILNSINKKILHSENEIRTKIEGVVREGCETHYSSTTDISMMVLGGFIAAAGIAAVAIALTVLNATTFGVAGLVAGIGVAAALSGVGLFATGAYKYKNTTSDIPLMSCPYKLSY